MKLRNLFVGALAILGLAIFFAPAGYAQTCDGTGTNFVDLNGDGFNDNAPDHDGDGIPNGLDPDYVKNAQDGDGLKQQKKSNGVDASGVQSRTMTRSQQFNLLQKRTMSMFQMRLGALGSMNGTGTGVCDGSGGGAGSGTGVCDGTGPKGNQRQGGK